MKKLPFKAFKEIAVMELLAGNAVMIFVRSNNWFDFNATLVQIKSFFCHVEWLECLSERKKGDIDTICANGKYVVWESFDRYQADVEAGRKELTLGVIKIKKPIDRRDMTVEMQSQRGYAYDDGQNKWEALEQIVSWFGAIGKMISASMQKKNLMGDPKKFNCSESSARGARAPHDRYGNSLYNILGKKDVQGITPEDLSKAKDIKLDYQTEKGK